MKHLLALAGLDDDVMRLCESECIVSVDDMDMMEETADFNFMPSHAALLASTVTRNAARVARLELFRRRSLCSSVATNEVATLLPSSRSAPREKSAARTTPVSSIAGLSRNNMSLLLRDY
jgi:hypothetical protein